MKRLSNFFYLVSQGVKSVFKNAVMSVASLLTLLCCLLVLGSFYMIIDNIGENAKMTDKLNQLVVTLDKSLTDEQIESVKQSVDKLDNILSWTYKSKEEALEEMRNNEHGVEIVSNVTYENNPLPNTIEITFADVANANTLVYQLEKLEGVTEVSDKLEVAQNIDRVKNGLTIVAVVMMGILLPVSLFVIMNTIKLTVFARREEIDIMRYVGSTGFFVTMPFITEGAFIGLLAAAAAFGLQYYIYTYVFVDILSDFDIFMNSFWHYAPLLAIAFVAVGLFTGVVASGLSVKRYSHER